MTKPSASLRPPPVGAGLYIASAMSGTSITRLSRLVLPYLVASLVVILIVILVPWVLRPF